MRAIREETSVRNHRNRARKAARGMAKEARSALPDDILLQPWFLPKRLADAIRGIVPTAFYNKMRYYFDDYGCVICGKETEHHSNGMCVTCYQRVLSRMKKSVKRRARPKANQRLDLLLFRQQKLAKNLLKGLAPINKAPAEKLTLQMYRPSNPVYEAFSAHHE